MRVDICYEDAIQYQWFLVKDSIQLPEEAPLTWGFDWQRLPIGKAKDFRREEDGLITAELEFFKEEYQEDVETLLKNDDAAASMYANEVVDERCEDLRIVYKAVLKAVAIVMTLTPANPGAVI